LWSSSSAFGHALLQIVSNVKEIGEAAQGQGCQIFEIFHFHFPLLEMLEQELGQLFEFNLSNFILKYFEENISHH